MPNFKPYFILASSSTYTMITNPFFSSCCEYLDDPKKNDGLRNIYELYRLSHSMHKARHIKSVSLILTLKKYSN